MASTGAGLDHFRVFGALDMVFDILEFPLAYRIPVSSISETLSGILDISSAARKPNCL